MWNRVRHVGLDELMQFDWTLVGEADALVALLASAPDLAAIDQVATQQCMRRLTEVIADRRRYTEVIALRIGISPLTRLATPGRRRDDGGTRLGERPRGMTERGVEAAAAAVLMTPRDGMVRAHRPPS